MNLPREHCKKCDKLEVRMLTDQHKDYVNEKFEPWRSWQCPECRRTYEREKSKRAYLKKKNKANTPSEYNWKCVYCEKDFKTTYRGSNKQGYKIKYCSKKCRSSQNRLDREGLTKDEGKCSQCSSIYMKSKDSQRTCRDCKNTHIKKKEENKDITYKTKAEYNKIKKNSLKYIRYAKLLKKRKDRLIKLKLEQKHCQTCEKEMSKQKRKYCSKKCTPRSPSKNAARKALKRMKKERKLSCVTWKQIADYYAKCPTGYVVDHIVPLNGKNVSGLHVPWNLQYLTPEENGTKGNRF